MSKGRFLILSLVVLLVCGQLFGQTETGQISGTVTDPSGAVVPNANVTVTNLGTGAVRRVTSSNNGYYAVTNLQPGNYEVKVEAPGFKEFTSRSTVSVGARNTADAQLTTGGSSTTIEVTAGGVAEVNTETQQLSQVVNSQQIVELPTITRNPYALVATSGNVSDYDPSGRGVGVAINGQRSASTDILLDGGENVDLFSATPGQSVPLDSVQEFRVSTSNFTAEYGRASGGVVNVATKSGTNDLHGTAYEFYRGAGLAANTYDNVANGIPKPNFVRNQFGYSLGGPIIKNKLFFFQSTEWTRVRSTAVRTVLVPSAAFIAASAPETQAFFAAHGMPPAGTPSADAPGFDQVSYTFPADAGGGAPQNTYSLVGRVDLNVSDKTQLFGRYGLESLKYFAGYISDSPYPGYNTGENVYNNNFLLNLTHTWTNNLVTQSKVVYNRLNDFQPLGDQPVGPTLYGFSNRAWRINGIRVALPGYLPFSPGSAIPFGGPQNLYQFYQDLNWNLGSHQVRFGGQYIHTRDNRAFGAYQEAVETLATNTTDAITALQTGNLNQFQVAINPQGKFPCQVNPAAPAGTDPRIATPDCTVNLPATAPSFSRNNRFNDFAAYAQDTWKVHPRLTLNLGLRWEYYGVQHNADPSLDSNFYRGTGNQFQQVATGTVQLAQNSPVGGLWKPDYNNFAPRIGIAWDIFGDGKTSLRGGYGISYERNFGNVTFNVIQNPPNYLVLSVRPGDFGGTLKIDPNNFGPLSGTGAVPLPRGSLRAIQQDIPTAYAHMWSAALEREVAQGMVVSLEYSGSKGVDLYSIENPNRAGSGILYGNDAPTDDPVLATLNKQYTGINLRGSSGFSNYNGLNAGIRMNNFKKSGVTLTANYTWAHSIDNLSSTFSEAGNNFNLGLLDPWNPELDKGNADFDIRHRVVVSGLWDMPWWRQNANWFLKQVVGGWSIAPIFEASSGPPFTIWDCTNAAYEVCPRWVPAAGAFPLTGNGSVADSGGNTFPYLTIPAAAYQPGNYVNTTLGISEFGECGPGQGATTGCIWPANMTRRNEFRAPGRWNLTMGLYKNFLVTERVKLQFRSEFYNIFNHHNLYISGADADVSASDTMVAKKGGLGDPTDERRAIQLGLKIIF